MLIFTLGHRAPSSATEREVIDVVGAIASVNNS